MVSEFSPLLPPAGYLTTPVGRAAYYVHQPLNQEPAPSPTPSRILMVHGVQTPALGLQPLASALRKAYPYATIALFDHWGHGLSDTPILPHTPALFHDLIDRVLDAINWPTAHFIGYSFGGVTIAGYAASSAARAARMESMVMIAPAGLVNSAATFPAEERQRFLTNANSNEEDERAAQEWVLRFLEGPSGLVVPDDWRERVAGGEVVAESVRGWEVRTHPGHMASVVGILRDGGVLDSHDVFVKATETGVRMLAVLGGTDDICGMQDLEKVGVHNVVVVPDVGHAIVRQKVPDVVAHIETFWRNL